MNNILIWLILPYFLIGTFSILLPYRRRLNNILFLFATTIGLIISIFIFFNSGLDLSLDLGLDFKIVLRTDSLVKSILPFVNLFGFLVVLYSFDFVEEKKRSYYFSLMCLIGFANLVLISGDFFSFLFAWAGILVLLYGILLIYESETAKYTFYLLGFADFLLLLGVVFYIVYTGSYKFDSRSPLELKGILPSLS
ncbi:MAG: hypothetical protein N2Z79_01745, partial [Candidatus Omnitrophica bacterium]|nr:hypothetical protein [Candidatus Omnitrophota bacterium]